jgi:hypothetical protein
VRWVPVLSGNGKLLKEPERCVGYVVTELKVTSGERIASGDRSTYGADATGAIDVECWVEFGVEIILRDEIGLSAEPSLWDHPLQRYLTSCGEAQKTEAPHLTINNITELKLARKPDELTIYNERSPGVKFNPSPFEFIGGRDIDIFLAVVGDGDADRDITRATDPKRIIQQPNC